MPATNEVPVNWALKPAALGVGDKFRLLFVTGERYSLFVQNLNFFSSTVRAEAAGGHSNIQRYASSFTPIACSYNTSAIGNAGTPTSESSVSVYWLGGEKVADNYADLYDGSWDSNEPRFPDGTTAPISGDGGRVAHGCQSSGRSHDDHYIGESRLMTGQPGSSGSEFEDTHFGLAGATFRMYGLSGIYQVVARTNSAPVFSDATLTREVVENSVADVNVGAVIPVATDADTDDTLTYSMEGTDAASFAFDMSSRQITTLDGVTYDFEDQSSYSVTIRADDNNGGTATVEVTITLK